MRSSGKSQFTSSEHCLSEERTNVRGRITKMAEFQKIVKERMRMCEQYHTCKHCPLGELQEKDDGNAMCRALAFQYPEVAERIIMQWASEHPIKTNGMIFSEVFGFDLDALYSVSEATIKWLNEEYKGGDHNG